MVDGMGFESASIVQIGQSRFRPISQKLKARRPGALSEKDW